jgi:hypothetical protein
LFGLIIERPSNKKNVNGNSSILGANIRSSIPMITLVKQNASHITSRKIPKAMNAKPIIVFMLI